MYEATEIVIKPVESDEESRLANDLMAKVHYQPNYFGSLHWLETCGVSYPGFRREHTRLALWKNDLAGVLRLTTDTIRIGEARLKMGGFGGITTVPRYRNRGVCRALMLDTFKYMERNNYHVAMLFGIPNFYHRFGFTTSLADCEIVLELEEALTLVQSAFRIREAKPGDIPAIQKIHAANDGDTACSLLRSSGHLTNKWDLRHKGMYVLTTGQGRVVAYYFANRKDDHLRVEEVGTADAAAYPHVLAACAKMAADEAVARVHFLAPPVHPFARFLLQYRTTHEMHIVRDSGGMMAFVNIGETLESLIPEWEHLLAKSALRDVRAEVTLLVDRTHYRIRAHHGAIDVAPSPGATRVSLTAADLMHLVTGYFYLEDILATRRRILTEQARALLGVLFPKRTPYVWRFDRF